MKSWQNYRAWSLEDSVSSKERKPTVTIILTNTLHSTQQ
jgi:hypothetical protein